MNKFIFDRSLSDVERWRTLRDKGWANMTSSERKEWLSETAPVPSAAKGMYTHNDLNRVESGVKEITELFIELGRKPPTVEVKTDWTHEDKITKEEIKRYLSNVETIRGFNVVFPDTPKTPSIDKKFDHLAANNIEKILSDVFNITNNTINSWCTAGEIISGEV